jgi:putative hydrolase of the HAD superfamily
MQNEIEGIAFDLDGTLYPNYRLRSRILPSILKNIKLVIAFGKTRGLIREEQEDASFKHESRQGDAFYRHQAEITAKLLGAPVSGELKDKIDREIYRAWEAPFTKIRLFSGVKETLFALRQAGYKLGMLSDFPPEIKLESLKISGIWDAVLCSERCGALKPHPLPFLELAKAMNLSAEKILYVGNSYPYDVAGAAGAGMKTAWIKSPISPSHGSKKPIPDFIFSNYRQLHDFMIN